VTSSRRSRFLPDLPSMSEALPGTVVDSWQAFFAPAGTPKDIVGKLNAEFTALLKTKEVIDSFETQGFEAGGGSPDDLGKFVRDETTKWAPIMKTAGIKAD
jgi:tripartite-type tricarboxylate transporter receptor subunit TctC